MEKRWGVSLDEKGLNFSDVRIEQGTEIALVRREIELKGWCRGMECHCRGWSDVLSKIMKFL
jgi:hypothetical protein